MSEPVKVNILDREFLVACPPEERAALLESAQILSERMREIRDSGKIVGMDRIAVMAALNLTHEMLQARREAEGSERVRERLAGLDQRVSEYLDAVEIPAELRRR
ncbi:cell division protein ZapA [Spiribacter halobius]|uniref:Cell division protein ZapA n=1 Tax=Sediminicurvatus halobius TaxID=2182432 RepID=A0A2U2N1K9_9GAMM|nr:cell division protein ZapA [Spiribacter halobius]PWG62972.1 cell division protein ZapA [Spiribacter halobius]UEX77486.1 cell division protein ZapA [Spiribacter halobius]